MLKLRHKYKRILAFMLAILMVINMVPTYSTYADEVEDEVTVWYFDSASETMKEAETVELYRGGEQIVSALLHDDVIGDVQWQIEAEPDLWVDIQGETAEDLRVSYGMVKSLLNDDMVSIRCAVEGDEEYYSEPFTVVVTDEDNRLPSDTFNIKKRVIAPEPLPAPEGISNNSETEDNSKSNVVIKDKTESVDEKETESVDEPETKSAAEPESVDEPEPESAAEPESVEEKETKSVEENKTEKEKEETPTVIAKASVPTPRILPHTTAYNKATGSDVVVVNSDISYYTITIEYVYTDDKNSNGEYLSKFHGQRVALPYIAEVAAGDKLDETVISPNCVGYTPDSEKINLGELGAINGNRSLTVKYAPADVSYTVRHYKQNVNDDDYEWVDTTMATGKTEALTSDAVAENYTGFTALSHYHEAIAADGSTMIDIYYDRNYYLISFDLDGGYGVEAIYARYGALVEISSNPSKTGYTFVGWDLLEDSDGDGIAENYDGNVDKLPSKVPYENSKYKALWIAKTGGSSYTVAYWLENADIDNKYDFVGAKSFSADAGTFVSGGNNAVADGIFTNAEVEYYTFNNAKTSKNITVAGDGSTVVNVYYDRNEYTLKFYYARLDGTTYDIADNTNGSSANRGTVDSASWQGNFATKPTLDSKYTEQSEVINGKTYYYFTITAKYGASLIELWPNAPLSQAGNYKFISWGTHYGSGYYNNNSNKNIKGVYSILDSGLLIDPTVTAENGVNHWMVGYWNTAPTMYTYEIYYSVLNNETVDRTYNGIGYKKINEYIVGSTDTPSGQTALSFIGVNYVGKDYDSNDKVNGTAIRFYYQRISSTVMLDNNYGNKITYTIPYGSTISSYITKVPEPDYPNELPSGAYGFGGWYQSKEGIGELDISITMPNEDLLYYALWTPKVYEVKISDSYGNVNSQGVKYDEKVTKPTDPTREDATFIGWYYMDENDVEQRFDFDNMTINQDITIYAKWRSNQMKKVEIHYVVEDANGNQTQIADTETLMMRLGQTRTFDAKTGGSLYSEYRSGCFPTTSSHSITVKDSDIGNTDPITYTFVYKKYGSVPYQVEFYVKENDGTERPAFKVTKGKAEFVDSATYAGWSQETKDTFASSNKSVSSGTYLTEGGQYIEQHWQNDKAVVIELYAPDNLNDSNWILPDAYIPNALKIQKIIVPSNVNPETNIEANTIKFVYSIAKVDPNDPNKPIYESRYLVQHYIQNVTNKDVYDLYSYSDETGFSGKTATASPISIPGYMFNSGLTDTKKQQGTLLNETTNEMTGTISAKDDLELNFYYTANSYPYQVMYLEQDTNRVLAKTKTTDFQGNVLEGLYGAKVTEHAIDLNGDQVDEYDVVGAKTKSIYIQMEAGSSASVNTIVFYYKLKNADLIISKTVALDEEQAKEAGIAALPPETLEQEFTFTVYCPTGYNKSFYDCTISENGKADIIQRIQTDDTFNMTVKLKHGQTIQIHGLIMGTYRITETYVPGFRITVNDGSDAQQMENATVTAALVEANQNVRVDFKNSYPFYTGDLVLGKTVTKADTTDPVATEPYKVTVKLEPDNEAREVDRVITWKDADGTNKTVTVPRLKNDGTDLTNFMFDVFVPVDGTVTLNDVPCGEFTATETVKGTVGYISDYYVIKTYSKQHDNEQTVSASGSSVNGVIHGGHPTIVTFTNTYKKGDLTIHKTVTQQYEKDSWSGDTFTFQITGTTELPDGEYNVDGAKVTVSSGSVTVKNENGANPSIIIKKTDGATKWSGSLTFENLPAGYYTVMEIADNKYETAGPTGRLLVNSTTTATEAEFTNTYKRTTGSLQVGKTIEIVGSGYNIDTSKEFDFNVSLTDGTLAGSYSCKVTTLTGANVADGVTSLSVTKGMLTFKLKHDQKILIENLPVGKYEVSETPVKGYASHFNGAESATEKTIVNVTTNNTTTVNCNNKYPVNFGTLTVSKTVVTPEDYLDMDKAPENDIFEFTVKVDNYDPLFVLKDFVTARFSSNDSNTNLNINGNILTFTLKDGGSVDLNLPVCSYTIQEKEMSSEVNTDNNLSNHYTSTFKVGDNVNTNEGVAGQRYNIVSGERETVIFTNTYKRHYANLTIETTGEDPEQSYIFTVTQKNADDSNGNISLRVVLNGNTSKTITGLPVGTYNVHEESKWSWRQKALSDQKVYLDADKTVSFAFGRREFIYWLSGYSYGKYPRGGNR